MYIVHSDQILHNKSITTGKMDYESSSLKLKFYLFSSASAEQRQDQRQMTLEEKKVGVRDYFWPTNPVRRSEFKQARQRSARKQATSKNRVRQRHAKQERQNGNERWIVT